jgi:hypothetical protein
MLRKTTGEGEVDSQFDLRRAPLTEDDGSITETPHQADEPPRAPESDDAALIRITWAATSADPTQREPLGKIWVPEGRWPVTSGVKREAFVYERPSYIDLIAYANDLAARMHDGGFAIVAGSPLPDYKAHQFRCRDVSNFIDEPSWVFTFDFDDLMAEGARLDRPEAFGPVALAEALKRLPAAFDSDAILYATSRSGLARGARFRLVFWLSRPLSFAAQRWITLVLKKRAGLGCLDTMVCVVSQFSFVERPKFPDGMADPIKAPVIFCEGVRRRVDVDALLAELKDEFILAHREEWQPETGTHARPASAERRLLDVDPAMRAELIEQLVRAIPNDIEDRGDWLAVAHAIKGSTGIENWGEDLWLEFCARWVKGDDPDEDERVWESVRLDEGKAGVGALLRLARQAGTPEAITAIEAIRNAQGAWRQTQAKTAFTPLTIEDINELPRPWWLDQLNERFAYIEDRDAVIDRRTDRVMSIAAFDRMHFNKRDSLGKNAQPISKLWFKHAERAEFETADYDPRGTEPAQALNLWTGLAIKPAAGPWPTIREHLREVLCCSDAGHYDYLLKLLQWKIQFPVENPEVAVLLVGETGAGKGTLVRLMERVFGQRRVLQFTRSDDVSNRFNRSIEGKVVIAYDEVLFAGDPRLRGRLKSEISEPRIPIEPKGLDSYTVRNIALRLFASNEAAPLPIDPDDRRFLVLAVSAKRARDPDYFARLRAAIDGDEARAFVADALATNLGAFDQTRRMPPRTAARAELARSTATTEHEYFFELLCRGQALARPWNIVRTDVASPSDNPWRDGPVTVGRNDIYDDYCEWLRRRGRWRREPITRTAFENTMRRILSWPLFRSKVVTLGGVKSFRGLYLGPLRDCRSAYDGYVKSETEWDDGDPIGSDDDEDVV